MSKTIDFQSGIIATNEADFSFCARQNPIRFYVEDLIEILSLRSGCKGLLHELIIRINKNGIINLTRTIKSEIAQTLALAIGTFDNYLSELVRAGVFRRIGRGKLEINPYLFVRNIVPTNGREIELKMSVTYFPSGERKVEVSAKEQ